MALFHLHARLLEGGLASPTRNELQSEESDDRAELERLAEVLAARGFAVWLYEHDPRRRTGLDPDGFVVVAEWNARGERVR